MTYYVVCDTCGAIESAWKTQDYAEKVANSRRYFSDHEFYVTSFVTEEMLEKFNSNGGNWNN